MPPCILWFRNDLRLLDNLALQEALVGGGDVWPFFALDPRLLRPNAFSEQDAAKCAHRVRFLLQSLEDLRARLQALGSDLLVVQAPACEVLPTILASAACEPVRVIAQDEPAWPETDAQQKVGEALERSSPTGELCLVWGSTCFHRDDLGFAPDLSDMPPNRGGFGVVAERAAHVRFPMPAPEAGVLGTWSALTCVSDALIAKGFEVGIPSEAQVLGAEAAAADSDPLAVIEFVGGEEAGLARVEEYIWENEENLEVYFDTRNGFLGRDFSRCLQMLLRDTMHKSENSLQLRPSILLLLCPLLAACTYFRVNQQIFAVARPRMPIPPVVLLGDHKVGER